MSSLIYLDHAAFTPPEPVALEAVHDVMTSAWGNPDSLHGAGRRARARLDDGLRLVAEYLGCSPSELRATANARSALTSALSWLLRSTSGPLVVNPLEHPALLEPIEAAARNGREVRWLPLLHGDLDYEGARATLNGADVVVCASVNHELGIQSDLTRLFGLAPRAYWLVDAVQAAPWFELGALFGARVFVAISSPKLGGLPGLGVLRLPPELAYDRLFDGSSQRSEGALAWHAVAALGAACAARLSRRAAAFERGWALSRELLDGLRNVAPDLAHNAGSSWGAPILSVSVPGVTGAALETALDLRGVCISRTTACKQHLSKESPVVAVAFEGEPWRARAATRWSLGWSTTKVDIVAAIRAFEDALPNLRGQARPRVELSK